ncbi:MAG TPA: type III-B CRISPR module RAMP protein Cmr6 [Spirochaetota bacterium]|nr:type III-B CRISPR module RAMP protein Cmr6 [Spirochaetota bacterium]
MGNSKRGSNSHENQRRDAEFKIKRQLWMGEKFIIEAKGTGENVTKAKKDAEKNFNKNLMGRLNIDSNQSLLPDNLSLALSKYIPIIVSDDGSDIGTLIEKKLFLEQVSKQKIEIPLELKAFNFQLEGFKEIFSGAIKNSSRLICGLGSGSVLETSITLHKTWGVPYIPGSSFKGICRSVAFEYLCENKNLTDEDLETFQEKFYGELCHDDSDILTWQLLFGAQDFKSLLLFLDAYPLERVTLDLDIMNNHYADYYQDKKTPGDWENPVPIFFLTVKENTAFKFNVLFDRWRWEKIKREGLKIKKGKDEILLKIDYEAVEEKIKKENFIKEIIKEALKNYGVGSKRNLGYGMFNIQDNQK